MLLNSWLSSLRDKRHVARRSSSRRQKCLYRTGCTRWFDIQQWVTASIAETLEDRTMLSGVSSVESDDHLREPKLSAVATMRPVTIVAPPQDSVAGGGGDSATERNVRAGQIPQERVEEVVRTLTSTGTHTDLSYLNKEAEWDAGWAQTAQSTSQINLDQFRNDPRFVGIDGTGFATVIIDTGIDLDHPFFGPDVSPADGVADRIVFSYDFSGTNDSDASDFNGHGSHVTSIVASSDSTHTGMAPGADIIHLKVFPDAPNAQGQLLATTADIEEALQWVVANAALYNIASVNLSLGSGNVQALQAGPLFDEFAALAALSVITVVSSGNFFFPFESAPGINKTAADPNVISVGAVFDADLGMVSYQNGAIANTSGVDRITPFTQRHGELLDVLAPGASITGANQSGGTSSSSGTSQASPHISGIAVLAQQLAAQELGRRLTTEEFRSLLQITGVMLNDGDDEDDNVTNTGLDFARVDVLALGTAILDLRTGSLSGRVFADQNADASGTADPGLTGWTVFLDDNNNGTVDSGTGVHTSADVPLAISVSGTPAIRSSLTVSDAPGTITDVNVTLDISHTYVSDLMVNLIAPDGTLVNLFAGVGASGDNFSGTILDDEAAQPITSGTAPFAGSWQPQNPLSAFDGRTANGTWTLEIGDSFHDDGGTLNSWSLSIAYAETTVVTGASGEFLFDGVTSGSHVVRVQSQPGYIQTSPAGGFHTALMNSGGNVTSLDFGQHDTTVPLTIQSLNPEDDAHSVAVDADLAVTFSEVVQKGTGHVLIKRAGDDSVYQTIDITSPQVTVDGTLVTIDPVSNFESLTAYYVQIAAGAVQDSFGNDFVGIADALTWSFTTADVAAPVIQTLSPTDNAVGVSVGSSLAVTYNETVRKGTGNVLIKRISDDSTFATIDVTSALVSIAGTVVTIDLPTDMESLTGYYVQIAAGAIEDMAGNGFVGITNSTTWNFTTADSANSVISGTVFHDLNGNGIQDAGEPGLLNRIVFLDANGNNQLDAGEQWTFTASGGNYSFTGLAAGN